MFLEYAQEPIPHSSHVRKQWQIFRTIKPFARPEINRKMGGGIGFPATDDHLLGISLCRPYPGEARLGSDEDCGHEQRKHQGHIGERDGVYER